MEGAYGQLIAKYCWPTAMDCARFLSTGLPMVLLCCQMGCIGSTVSQKHQPTHGNMNQPALMDEDGQDVSRYPQTFSNGEWVSIEGALMSRQLVVPVMLDGVQTSATIDTGAMTTTITAARAKRLGIPTTLIEEGQKVKIIDAHGQMADGFQIDVPDLSIGKLHFSSVTVTIVMHQQDVFLLGWNILKDFDIFLAADEGLVGFFKKGTGPILPQSHAVSIKLDERQALIRGRAPGQNKEVPFDLVIDTGASVTSVPIYIGIEGKLPADIHYADRYLAVNSEREERGRFLLKPFSLGPERFQVPQILATASNIAGGRSVGLLGNDVLTAYHTLLNFKQKKIHFSHPPRRPPHRDKGPKNQPCIHTDGSKTRCIEVSLLKRFGNDSAIKPGDEAATDLQITVNRAYRNRTLELLILAYDVKGTPLFQGGGLRAFISIGNDDVEQRFQLWDEMLKLGLSPGSTIELRRVRTENIHWPCDPMHVHCLSFSGPLSQSQ